MTPNNFVEFKYWQKMHLSFVNILCFGYPTIPIESSSLNLTC